MGQGRAYEDGRERINEYKTSYNIYRETGHELPQGCKNGPMGNRWDYWSLWTGAQEPRSAAAATANEKLPQP